MYLHMPDAMTEMLSEEAWLQVVEHTAQIAVAAANDLARQVMVLTEEKEGLERRLAGLIRTADQLRGEVKHWKLSAETQAGLARELADIVASRVWYDLLREEAEAIDELIGDGRKIQAIKQVRTFLGCSLGTAKTLVLACEAFLEREE